MLKNFIEQNLLNKVVSADCCTSKFPGNRHKDLLKRDMLSIKLKLCAMDADVEWPAIFSHPKAWQAFRSVVKDHGQRVRISEFVDFQLHATALLKQHPLLSSVYPSIGNRTSLARIDNIL